MRKYQIFNISVEIYLQKKIQCSVQFDAKQT